MSYEHDPRSDDEFTERNGGRRSCCMEAAGSCMFDDGDSPDVYGRGW